MNPLSEDRFRSVFEHSRLGNKIISSDLVILQVNPALVELLGYTHKEDIIGTRIFDYTPIEFQKDWKVVQENLWKRASPSFSIETCLRRKDGTILWCQVTSILFQDNGETLGYTIIEDITEQHHLRQQKEEFISVASHELKTPITTLKATLQLINRSLNIESTISAKLIQLARNAELNTIKLANLVDDLLSTTRIEQGQLALNKHHFVFSDLVDGCCSHIELHGKYYLTYKGDHAITVCADQQKIEQVLINLVNNAVKYAPESAEIIIEVQQLAEAVKVSVTDHGPGIPAESIPRLFDRYFRADKNPARVTGLGLGLYIASEIIRRHKGEMGTTSIIGEGSSFWFTLPE